MIVTLDFETYYDADYTLKKMSTSEYIRDERFEALCCSIKRDGETTDCRWGHAEIRTALQAIDWTNTELLAHHAQFEGLILSHHFGVRPKIYRCTLSMARALFPKSERNDLASVATRLGVANKLPMPDFKGRRIGAIIGVEEREAIGLYCSSDVESCYAAYLKMVGRYPNSELRLIDITVRMFADPVLKLDMPLAEAELKREQDERTAAIENCGAAQYLIDAGIAMKPKKKGDPITNLTVLASNKMFPLALKQAGIEPPTKQMPPTKTHPNGHTAYAISKSDEDFIDLLNHPDDKIRILVSGRLAAKSTIGETRSARLIQSGSGGKKLPVYLNYYGAHTGRWSGGDKLNYQNLKKKGNIRKAILAPAGYQLVVIDSAQIEARVVAWLAGEEWLLDAFRNKRDVYSEFASTAYDKIVTKKDKTERFVGKTCVLGLGFQMGGPKLQKGLVTLSIAQGLEPVRLELTECYKLVNIFRAKNKNIVALWKFLHDEVIRDLAYGVEGYSSTYKCISYGREYIGLPNGLSLLYPETRARTTYGNAGGLGQGAAHIGEASYQTIRGRTKLYGGMLTENVVQALARIVVADQMLQISEKYRIVMMTHDEVVFLAPDDEAADAFAWGLKIMQTAPEWCKTLPVDAEGGYDVCYSK